MKASLMMGTVAAILAAVPGALGVTIDFVTVGKPGNPSDASHIVGLGAVAYEYGIGMYEITVGQYCEFLNAVADDDTYGLYADAMWSDDHGCKIQRTGSSGSYAYTVPDPNRINRPVNYVDWGDAVRFCNWLHNGQPTGAQDLTTTEDGSYFLDGATSSAALTAVTRATDATYVIPSGDEWYKAAYFDPLVAAGAGGYFDYPTRSNAEPNNVVADPDPGQNANFKDPCYAIGAPYYTTEVGEFEYTPGPWGTYDQGGNVSEWTEKIGEGTTRFIYGGAYNGPGWTLSVGGFVFPYPIASESSIGFRVAVVPEPGTIALLAVGVLALRRKHRFAARTA